jgi:F0F1-type ATP synthase assembly protein I
MKTQTSADKKHTSVSLNTQAVRICIELISGVIVGSSIGYILDEVFDFRFILLLVFTILGGAAGITNAVRYIHSIDKYKEDD